MRIALVVVAVLGLGVLGALPQARAQAAAIVEFDVPPQPLETALRKIAETQNLQIIFTPDDVRGVSTAGAKGRFTAREAIEELLKGTRLVVTSSGDRVFAIKPAPAGAGDKRTAADVIFTEGIVVTGSRIPRLQGEGPSEVVVIGKEDLERTGQPNIARVLQDLPSNYGGPRDTSFASGVAGTSVTLGSGINLRGAGIDATLVLINGRRPARSGLGGGFVDLSNIPTVAVERVEVLADGASAIYGADAVAGVVNIVLREDYRGREVFGRYAAAAGYDEWSAGGAFGAQMDRTRLFVAGEYYRQSLLTRADRRSFTLGNNFTSLGGSDFRSVNSNPGNVTAVDGNLNVISALAGRTVASLALPANQDGTQLTAAGLVGSAGVVNRFDLTAGNTLVPKMERSGLYATAERDLGGSTRLVGSILAGRRDLESHLSAAAGRYIVPASNPFNIFRESVAVTYAFAELEPPRLTSKIDGVEVAVGTKAFLDPRWNWEAFLSYGVENVDSSTTNGIKDANTATVTGALADSNPATALNLFGGPSRNNPETLAKIQGLNAISGKSDSTAFDLSATGPIAGMFGRELQVATGARLARESMRTDQTLTTQEPTFTRNRRGDRDSSAVFAETLLPLLAAPGRPAEKRLDLSIAARWDNYSDFGDRVSPKVGVAFQPVRNLLLRGSWSESFKPPTLLDLNDPVRTSTFTVADPLRPETVTVPLTTGGNPDLKAELSKTVSAGIVFNPDYAPGVRIALSYYDIRYTARIALPNILVALANPDAFPTAVVRGAPAASDPPGRPGRITAVDVRPINFARLDIRGVDLGMDYKARFGGVELGAGASVSYLDKYQTQSGANLAIINELGVVGRPPRVRATAKLSATWDRFTFTAGARYSGDARLTNNPGAQEIGATTLFDAQILARLPGGFEATLGALNLGDKDPAFVNQDGGFDPQVYDPRGRLVYLRILKRF